MYGDVEYDFLCVSEHVCDSWMYQSGEIGNQINQQSIQQN